VFRADGRFAFNAKAPRWLDTLLAAHRLISYLIISRRQVYHHGITRGQISANAMFVLRIIPGMKSLSPSPGREFRCVLSLLMIQISNQPFVEPFELTV
jgi:hypothetical protein